MVRASRLVHPQTTRIAPLAALGWGFYLAVSWTWIIGMILPALLMDDLGWWALAVFLIPNAIGAALMGTVLRDHEVALRLRQQHDKAIRRFSMVTIAFHLYVLSSIALSVEGFPSIGGQASVLILACVLAVGFLAIRRWLVIALAVWLVSVGLAIAFITSGASMVLAEPDTFDTPLARDLLPFAPAVALGFALCPYLDATFIRARASTGPTAGKVAFGFGFLGPFVIMIAFTVIYGAAIANQHPVGWTLILAHLAIQGGFTLAVHLRESKLSVPQRGVTLGMTMVALALSWSLPAGALDWAGNMMAWEVVYRLFLSAYGLFFPAYVLFAMLPSALGMGPMPKAGRAVAAITVAAVLPLYGLGFVALEEQWLPLALGVLLAGVFTTFVLRRRAARSSDG